MFIVVRVHPAIRSSGADSWRRLWPRNGRARPTRHRAARHGDGTCAWSSTADATATRCAHHRHDNGTSLARRTALLREDISVSTRTANGAHEPRARVKMLDSEIVFDIRRAVPEHVRPTREKLFDWDRVTCIGRNRSDRRTSNDDPQATHSCRQQITATSRAGFDVGSRASA
jgi:hypothetical protein